MERQEQEMKISPTTVRRLRGEHGWSQEQLAAASGLSLRTIQRVEADGSASLETRKCLAATFDIPFAALDDEPIAEQHTADTAPPSFTRYKISAAIGGALCVPAGLSFANLLPASMAWLGAVSSVAAIALLILSGLGWYFTGGSTSRSRMRRAARIIFIFAAIFCGFAASNDAGSANIAMSAQVGLLALFIYFTVDFLIARHRKPSNSA